MAEETTKYKLSKPETTDFVNVTTDISNNMDKIDNLTLMNRRDASDSAAALTWTGSSEALAVFNIGVPTRFAQPPQLSAVTNRSVSSTVDSWQPILRTKAPSTNGVTANGIFLYSTVSYVASQYAGLCIVSVQNSTGDDKEKFVWMGGNLNVNDFAVCRQMRYEESDWAEYYVIYARKKNSNHSHVLTTLAQWYNSNAGVAARLWESAIDWPELPNLTATDPPASYSDGTMYISKTTYSTAGIISTATPATNS